jgi:hypothetical protein
MIMKWSTPWTMGLHDKKYKIAKSVHLQASKIHDIFSFQGLYHEPLCVVITNFFGHLGRDGLTE